MAQHRDAEPLPERPPSGLRLSRLAVGASEVVVLSYPVAAQVELSRLTAAESEIVTLLVRGRSNAEIAAHRGTTARTVSKQIDSIYKKLGVHSRAELTLAVASER
jgi:DNA-binding NarL/FixJ family response regulator